MGPQQSIFHFLVRSTFDQGTQPNNLRGCTEQSTVHPAGRLHIRTPCRTRGYRLDLKVAFCLKPGPAIRVWVTHFFFPFLGEIPGQENFIAKRRQKKSVAKRGCHGARAPQGKYSAGLCVCGFSGAMGHHSEIMQYAPACRNAGTPAAPHGTETALTKPKRKAKASPASSLKPTFERRDLNIDDHKVKFAPSFNNMWA